jgi:beta-glucosidase
VDEVALHEVFLPHFRHIIDEGVAVVMSAYNSVNGEWCGQNEVLLSGVLREEWGFEGFVISDWIFGLRDAARSVTAGLDVEMPYRMVRADGLEPALADGAASWDDVDRAVVRTMATLIRFDHLLAAPRPDLSVLASVEHRGLAREAAAKSIVLLRNEAVGGAPVLPLDASALGRVAVIGRLAAERNTGDGGSSDVWATEVVTPLEGLRAAWAGSDGAVAYDDGSDPVAAAALAAGSDVALVVVGYTRADEGEFIGEDNSPGELRDLMPGPDDPALAAAFEAGVRDNLGWDPPEGVSAGGSLSFATGGDRSSLRLHAGDEALIAAVAAGQPRTVVAVVAGSAVLMSTWAGTVPAIVQSWYAGMEGGHALADVLLGRAGADGRLPFSVPASEADLPEFTRETDACTYDAWHGWWKLERDGRVPQFPFGFGLSYTTFEWGEFSSSFSGAVAGVVVRGTVANRGERAGAEVVQVYGWYGDEDPSARGRRLVGFARVALAPGEETAVEVTVPYRRFEVRDPEAHRWVLRPGPYVVAVGRHAGDPGAQQLELVID